jgi:hypothetical protein
MFFLLTALPPLLSFCLSVRLFVYLSVSLLLSVRLSVCVPVSVSAPFLHLSIDYLLELGYRGRDRERFLPPVSLRAQQPDCACAAARM